MAPNRPIRASSPVSWALLTGGVTEARVAAHRLRLLLDRASRVLEDSPDREAIYAAAGDLLTAIPEKMADAERALDRTAYALARMGGDFLRGRLSIDDRNLVEEGTSSSPLPPKESSPSASRVARRYREAAAKGPAPFAPSAEEYFFDSPRKREVAEFAESGARSNDKAVALKAVKESDTAATSTKEEGRAVALSPYTPSEVLDRPGGDAFSTLNRYIVKTEERVRGVPKKFDDLPKQETTLPKVKKRP